MDLSRLALWIHSIACRYLIQPGWPVHSVHIRMQPVVIMLDLDKPYYFLRPSQLRSRIVQVVSRKQLSPRPVMLPWGLEVFANPTDHIGLFLLTHGIYDIEVCETMWRL